MYETVSITGPVWRCRRQLRYHHLVCILRAWCPRIVEGRGRATKPARGSSVETWEMKWLLWFSLLILVLCIAPLWNLFNGDASMDQDWRTATRASTGIAPDPA